MAGDKPKQHAPPVPTWMDVLVSEAEHAKPESTEGQGWTA